MSNQLKIDLLGAQLAQVQRRREEIEHQEAALFEERQLLVKRHLHLNAAIGALTQLDMMDEPEL